MNLEKDGRSFGFHWLHNSLSILTLSHYIISYTSIPASTWAEEQVNRKLPGDLNAVCPKFHLEEAAKNHTIGYMYEYCLEAVLGDVVWSCTELVFLNISTNIALSLVNSSRLMKNAGTSPCIENIETFLSAYLPLQATVPLRDCSMRF